MHGQGWGAGSTDTAFRLTICTRINPLPHPVEIRFLIHPAAGLISNDVERVVQFQLKKFVFFIEEVSLKCILFFQLTQL